MKVLFFILLIKYLKADFNKIQFGYEELNLTNTLMQSYQKEIRPNKKVVVTLDFSLNKITNLDEKTQILTTSSHLFANWSDERLAWNKSSFNTEHLPIHAEKIWLPDLYVTNSAESNAFIKTTDSNIVWISDGNVYVTYDLTGLKTQCEINSLNFPFDEQNCSIKIGSWQFNVERIDFKIAKKLNISSFNYIPNQLWELKAIDGKMYLSNSSRIHLKGNWSQQEIHFEMAFKRRPSYYLMNNIFPCLVLNVIGLLLFTLPFTLQATLSNKFSKIIFLNIFIIV